MSNYVNSVSRKEGLVMKDFIVTGVFGALLLMCAGLGGFPFAINPALTFYFPVGAALLPGPVYMLYLAKVKKRGGVTIVGVVIALLVLLTGMHWGMAVTSVICSVLADVVAGIHSYQNKMTNLISYVLYSFGTTGSYIVFFINAKAWAGFMMKNGTTQEYIATMEQIAAGGVVIQMFLGTALVAVLSGLVGNTLLRKQFEKAGVTE